MNKTFESITTVSNPFIYSLVSYSSVSDEYSKNEQFELPNLGLATARYLNQVRILVEPVSDVFTLNNRQETDLQQTLDYLEPKLSIKYPIRFSYSLTQLLEHQIPKEITKIGL